MDNNYTRKDIEKTVSIFKSDSTPEHRYASFDYCYDYFKNTNDLGKDIEKSCLALGFYLASWGMLRGSSFLLQKSGRHFYKTIEYFTELKYAKFNYWEIDVNNYNPENIEKIIEIFRKTKDSVIDGANSDLTLVTKILLGVFGFIPAYDKYFTNTFRGIFKEDCGFRKVNKNSLRCIHEFYKGNRDSIDKLANTTYVFDFKTGKETKTKYTQAKIIDMYGFTKSVPKALAIAI